MNAALLTASSIAGILYLYLIRIHVLNRDEPDRECCEGQSNAQIGEDGMDTKFSVAVHALVLISEAPLTINSDQIAASVGTNASYIRKILSLLKKAGIVEGRRGIGGYSLTAASEQITLLQIYQAVMENRTVHLLDIHQNPSDQCVVGRFIRPVMTGMFAEAEDAFTRALAGKTLADCIDAIRKKMDEAGNP